MSSLLASSLVKQAANAFWLYQPMPTTTWRRGEFLFHIILYFYLLVCWCLSVYLSARSNVCLSAFLRVKCLAKSCDICYRNSFQMLTSLSFFLKGFAYHVKKNVKIRWNFKALLQQNYRTKSSQKSRGEKWTQMRMSRTVSTPCGAYWILKQSTSWKHLLLKGV